MPCHSLKVQTTIMTIISIPIATTAHSHSLVNAQLHCSLSHLGSQSPGKICHNGAGMQLIGDNLSGNSRFTLNMLLCWLQLAVQAMIPPLELWSIHSPWATFMTTFQVDLARMLAHVIALDMMIYTELACNEGIAACFGKCICAMRLHFRTAASCACSQPDMCNACRVEDRSGHHGNKQLLPSVSKFRFCPHPFAILLSGPQKRKRTV